MRKAYEKSFRIFLGIVILATSLLGGCSSTYVEEDVIADEILSDQVVNDDVTEYENMEQDFKNVALYDFDYVGSASRLEGRVLVVTIYVNDDSDKWNESDKEKVREKIAIATDYIQSQAETYDKSLEFIYDTGEEGDLAYDCTYDGIITDGMELGEEEEDPYQECLLNEISKEIYYDELLEAYEADSIAYVGVVNKSGGAYAYPYEESEVQGSDEDKYWNECCCLFMSDETYGEEEPPAVYAHELLHLFGAEDLYKYEDDEDNVFANEQYDYILEYYGNEIMNTTYDENENSVQDQVTNEISEITAYYVGWTYEVPEDFFAIGNEE